MTREKRVEEEASINNESDFDKVADALVVQQPRVHLRESRKRPKEKGKDTHWFQEGGKQRDNGKNWNECLLHKVQLRRGLRSR